MGLGVTLKVKKFSSVKIYLKIGIIPRPPVLRAHGI